MNEESFGTKLLLSYEVNSESLQEYYQFVMTRYIPTMQSLGLQMSEAWHTAYGDAPNRLIGFVTDNQENMLDLLQDDDWLALNDQLEQYVSEFTYKMIPYRGGFQI